MKAVVEEFEGIGVRQRSSERVIRV